jgi:hypothetical protein
MDHIAGRCAQYVQLSIVRLALCGDTRVADQALSGREEAILVEP